MKKLIILYAMSYSILCANAAELPSTPIATEFLSPPSNTGSIRDISGLILYQHELYNINSHERFNTPPLPYDFDNPKYLTTDQQNRLKTISK
ncbi:MAG: hypothetical protein ACXW2E_01920 [Nitrososphaeraceae archaeon]